MNKLATILIVEDEKPIRQFIKVSLEAQGYKCLEADKGETAITLVTSHQPEIIILDLGLPDIDGLDVIEKIRNWYPGCIIVVSARERDREKIEALDAGADDYLTKPFSNPELQARIRVALRHQQNKLVGNERKKDTFQVGDLEIDYEKRKVVLNQQEIHFTPIEYDLMVLLSKQAGRVLTHRYILEKVWGTYLSKDTQSLRVFMANIRRKIEQDPIHPRYILTEVGIGYRMVDE